MFVLNKLINWGHMRATISMFKNAILRYVLKLSYPKGNYDLFLLPARGGGGLGGL